VSKHPIELVRKIRGGVSSQKRLPRANPHA
jgi:hypothetical protein